MDAEGLVARLATSAANASSARLAQSIGALIAFSGTLGAVFQTALYRFATEPPAAAAAPGAAISGFSNDDLALAFRPRRTGNRFS